MEMVLLSLKNVPINIRRGCDMINLCSAEEMIITKTNQRHSTRERKSSIFPKRHFIRITEN